MAETIDLEFWRTATEEQMRAADGPWPRTQAELDALVEVLANRSHDYGTCVYAMSVAATAAFHFIAHKIGVTGFQASCADLDVLRRTRGMKHGFRVLDYHDLLYPQTLYKFDLSADKVLDEDGGKLRWQLAKEASELLRKREYASREVVEHWQKLVKGGARV